MNVSALVNDFTYHELALVVVFAPAGGVLDLLAEDKTHLEEEEVSVAALTNQRLGIPHLEGLLKDQLPLRLNTLRETCRGG